MFQLLSRLILIVIAVSVLRRVIKIALSFWAGLSETKARPSASSASAGAHMSLVQDPVCGTYVAADTSLKRIVAGKVVCFCSDQCRDRFAA